MLHSVINRTRFVFRSTVFFNESNCVLFNLDFCVL